MSGRQPDQEKIEDAGYENPVVARLDRDLHAVLDRTDARLFIFIVVGLVASHLSSYVHVTPVVESVLLAISVAVMIGGIVFTIYSSIAGKRKVGNRYGVACGACGFRPKINDIVYTADLGFCPRCGAELRVHSPSALR